MEASPREELDLDGQSSLRLSNDGDVVPAPQSNPGNDEEVPCEHDMAVDEGHEDSEDRTRPCREVTTII